MNIASSLNVKKDANTHLIKIIVKKNRSQHDTKGTLTLLITYINAYFLLLSINTEKRHFFSLVTLFLLIKSSIFSAHSPISLSIFLSNIRMTNIIPSTALNVSEPPSLIASIAP